MSMYSGMMPSWTGTIIVATMTSSSALRPRKRSLAKANPASVEKNTTEIATTAETIAELTSALAKCASSLSNSAGDVLAEVAAGDERRRHARRPRRWSRVATTNM